MVAAGPFDELPQNVTLREAKEWLRGRVEEGDTCPCCTQYAKVYRRRVNAGMARALIALYHAPRGVIHFAQLAKPYTHESGQLAWWGLIDQDASRRDDGGRSGWWRITPLGEAYVRGQVSIPKYARVYDGKIQSLDASERANIQDALGKKFDYRELMDGV